MKYDKIIFGRRETTLTVFVPWDCFNNCPFCTTKWEYLTKYKQKNLDRYIDTICTKLSELTSTSVFTDIVFTGGEPFADIDKLKKLISCIKDRNIKIYVNTSLIIPDTEFTKLEKYITLKNNRLTGISVSVPMVNSFNNLRSIERLSCVMKPTCDIRMNAVVSGNEDQKEILKHIQFAKKFGFSSLVFRKNYMNTDQTSLYAADDKFFSTLMSISSLKYIGNHGCLVCNSNAFNYDNYLIVYHRGVNLTHLNYGKHLVINDFVMKQDGLLLYDWDIKYKVNKFMYKLLFNT